MSHINTMKAKVGDLDALITTTAKLGGVFHKGQTEHVYYRDRKSPCLHAISLPGCATQIGIIAAPGGGYGFNVDFYGQGQQFATAFGENLNTLVDETGFLAAKKLALKSGLITQRKQLPNGHIQLVVTGTSL